MVKVKQLASALRPNLLFVWRILLLILGLWPHMIPAAMILLYILSLPEFHFNLDFRSWITGLVGEEESGRTTIPYSGLWFVSLLALWVAAWRSQVAEKQVKIAQQSLLNERYQRGLEMLGSNGLPVRIGGIYTLQQLAKDFPKLYHLEVMRVFSAFVRPSTEGIRSESATEGDVGRDRQARRMRADVEAVMQVIGYRSQRSISLEQNVKPGLLYFRDADLSHLEAEGVNLSGAWLTNVNLSDAVLPEVNLSRANLRVANLSRARLRKADLTDTRLQGANLSEAKLWGSNLSGARLHKANLTGTDLCGVDANSPAYGAPVRGLTQAQLDEAVAEQGNPPKLDGVNDPETGKPLEWRGGT